jgi:hypothetical protein
LDVPLTFLLEGSPSGAAEARAVGYSPADSGPDPKIDVDLLQASVLVQQGAFKQAEQLLAPIQPERITTDQVYRLYLLRGQIHLGAIEYQEAVVDLRAAVTQGEGLNDIEYIERARNLLGKAYFHLYVYILRVKPIAMGSQLRNIIRYLAVNCFVVRLYFLTDIRKVCPNPSNVFKAVRTHLPKWKCKLIYVIGAILRLGDCSETLA